jgi:hypothetical protein
VRGGLDGPAGNLRDVEAALELAADALEALVGFDADHDVGIGDPAEGGHGGGLLAAPQLHQRQVSPPAARAVGLGGEVDREQCAQDDVAIGIGAVLVQGAHGRIERAALLQARQRIRPALREHGQRLGGVARLVRGICGPYP